MSSSWFSHRSQLLVSALCALATLATACSPDQASGPVVAMPASFTILDGGHGGNPHFFFLAPLAPATTYSGIPDVSFTPQVLITLGSNEIVRLDAKMPKAADYYAVDWQVAKAKLKVGSTYRLTVVIGGSTHAGYTEVVALSGGGLRDAVTGATIPLNSGNVLPIKFRLEVGATPEGISEVCEVGPPGTHTFSYSRAAESLVKGKPVPVAIESSPLTVASGECVPFWKSGWHDMMTVRETNLAADLLLDSIAVTRVPSGGDSGVCGDPVQPTIYCPAISMGENSATRELNPETAYRYTFYHRPKPQFSWYNVCAIPPHDACVSIELSVFPDTSNPYGPSLFVIRARNLEGTFGSIPWAAFNFGFQDMVAGPEPIIATPTRHAIFLGTAGLLASGDPNWANYCALQGCPNPSWERAEWDYQIRPDGTGYSVWTSDYFVHAVVGCDAPSQTAVQISQANRPGYFQTCGNGWIAFSFAEAGTWHFGPNSYASVFGWTTDGTLTQCYLALNATSCAAAPPENE